MGYEVNHLTFAYAAAWCILQWHACRHGGV